MNISITLLIAIVSAVCSFVFPFSIYKRGLKSDSRITGELHSDTQYIKQRIDDVLLEQKDFGRKIDTLAERVTRVEESTKQAHRRINDVVNGKR